MNIRARAQCAMAVVPARAKRLDKVELMVAVRSHTRIRIAGALVRPSVFFPMSLKRENKERLVDIWMYGWATSKGPNMLLFARVRRRRDGRLARLKEGYFTRE